MSGTSTVLHDPQGLVDAELPLDRAPYEALGTAVLAWQDPNLTPADYEQIALQLTGHARAVAADVQRHAAALAEERRPRRPRRRHPPRSRRPPLAADPGRRTLRPGPRPARTGPVTSAWTAWILCLPRGPSELHPATAGLGCTAQRASRWPTAVPCSEPFLMSASRSS